MNRAIVNQIGKRYEEAINDYTLAEENLYKNKKLHKHKKIDLTFNVLLNRGKCYRER